MSEKAYKCTECGLHYQDKKKAEECYKFCNEYKACSLEITKFSREAEGLAK